MAGLHRPLYNWKLGFFLTLSTVVLWGALPISLKILLQQMDGYTITWFRMFGSFVVLLGILGVRKSIPSFKGVGAPTLLLLLTASLCLGLNYILYVIGLSHTTPANAQFIIQTAPLFLLFGGLFIFKERFFWIQWVGVFFVFMGFSLFFKDQIQLLVTRFDLYLFGAFLITLSSMAWTGYALAQKQLLVSFSSQGILLVVYGFSGILFLPLIHPKTLLSLPPLHLLMLLFVCANTLLAYGAFSNALAYWEASRVSAVLALSPLFTLIFMRGITSIFPQVVAPEQISSIGIGGAILLIGGSMITSLGKR